MAVVGTVDFGFRADVTGVTQGMVDVENTTRSGLGKIRDITNSEAQKIARSVMTPFEKLDTELSRLSAAKGKGILSEETFQRASEKAIAEFDAVEKASQKIVEAAAPKAVEIVEAPVKAGLGKVKEEASKAGKEAGKGWVDNLKKGLGEESQFGNALKILQGAGAVAGLAAAGRVLNDLTSKAVSLRNEFNDGGVSGGQIADELAKSVPVLGSIYSAGRNIRDLFTGESSIVAGIERAAKLQDAVTESLKKTGEASKKWRDDTTRFLDDIDRKLKRAPLDGLPLKLFDNAANYEDSVRKINKDADDLLAGKDFKDGQATLSQLNAEVIKAQLALNDLRESANDTAGGVFANLSKERAAEALPGKEAELKELLGKEKTLRENLERERRKIEEGRKQQLDAAERGRKGLDKSDAASDLKEKAKKAAEEKEKQDKELAEKAKQAAKEEADYRKKMVDEVATAQEKYAKKIKELQSDLAKGRISQDTFGRQMEKARADLKEAQEKTPGMEKIKKDKEELKRMGEKIRDEVATPGEKFGREMTDALKAAKAGELSPAELRKKLAKERSEMMNANTLPKLEVMERRSGFAVTGQGDQLTKGEQANIAAIEKEIEKLDGIERALTSGAPRIVVVGRKR